MEGAATGTAAARHRRAHRTELGAAYEAAWEEWTSGDDADLWGRTAPDGLSA